MTPTQLIFLDPPKFDQSTGGYEEIKQEIAEAFIKHTPEILSELRQASQKANTKVISQLMHKLKSSAGLFCVDSLYNEMADIEKNPNLTPSYLTRIDKVIADIRVLMEEVKNLN